LRTVPVTISKKIKINIV